MAACPMGRLRNHPHAKPMKRYPKTTIVSTETLMRDTRLLLPHLIDVDAVVGVARSGMLPATILAVALHRPLYAVSRQHGVVPIGSGRRMDRYDDCRPVKTVLLVDDTMARGVIMRAVLPAVCAHFSDARVIRATVYAPGRRLHLLDLCAVEYDMPHYLLYNIFDAPVHCLHALFDMDGILCEDFTREEDDDGDRYLAAMATKRPRWLPRYGPVRIVTARLERYREPTMAWLDRHGIRVAELIMGPWRDPRERVGKIAEWKARQYITRRPTRCNLFIESDPQQAKVIAKLARRPVLCPSLPEVLCE